MLFFICTNYLVVKFKVYHRVSVPSNLAEYFFVELFETCEFLFQVPALAKKDYVVAHSWNQLYLAAGSNIYLLYLAVPEIVFLNDVSFFASLRSMLPVAITMSAGCPLLERTKPLWSR